LDKGVLSLEQLIDKFSAAPRKIYGLPAAEIKVGVKANMTFFDTETEWSVDSTKFLSRSNNTPYEGETLKGKVLGVVNGEKLFLNRSDS